MPSRARSQRRSRPSRGKTARVDRIAEATRGVVEDAAALLDEELAAGILDAKRIQQRFARDGRINSQELRDALTKVRGDVHDVVGVLGRQSGTISSPSMRSLATRFTARSHDLVDTLVELVTSGADLIDRLAKTTSEGRSGVAQRPTKRSGRRRPRRSR